MKVSHKQLLMLLHVKNNPGCSQSDMCAATRPQTNGDYGGLTRSFSNLWTKQLIIGQEPGRRFSDKWVITDAGQLAITETQAAEERLRMRTIRQMQRSLWPPGKRVKPERNGQKDHDGQRTD